MRPDSPLAHSKHVFRVFLLLIAGIVVLVLGRSLFVPPSWGQFGAYRGAALAQHRALDPRHGGNDACRECHDDEPDELAAGAHHSLACEGCHAPLSVHVTDGEWTAEMPVRHSATLCLGCHERLEARPASHPQIDPAAHLEEMDAEPGPESCVDCHEAHSPS